ncbi:PAPs reductase [Arthrobacter phage Salgado]|uniref:PAPs reductase n=3 Tax=Laroyevirus TaxID=1982086 RepID=A0A0U4B629_9CAUD|nr:phosphoadenosine phosphosulfate reductase [Arthrobacter phage Laroye]YP_010082519.1 phosphoadenosine phosphosulfate reductase [Arthrobacter phage LiSara]YP_010082615.1 phosphoadenosine phosphosulfate reductase [Arthrobacter phage Salgado]ALY09533.1 PAPs reductase [Arthrobacter phage Laroye]ALY10174.1 PAPs reductase [Arthrobacter phage Salgado]ASR83590.1 PAPs reductase [Arthrobacter phage LiSara]
MARYKQFIANDVYSEAKKRIHHIYDISDEVVVSFSGGKDSLVVLHLVKEVAQERGLEKVKVSFYDEELIPDTVINFVDHYRQQPWVDMQWWAVPMKSEKFILGDVRNYVQWDPNRPHVRPIPEHAITAEDLKLPPKTMVPQYMMEQLITKGIPGKVAILNGIRASESMTRLRASINKLNENYINKGKFPNVVFCKPIFDWSEDDVFKYFYDNGISYCPLYDAQAIVGGGLRVSTPLHSQSAKRIGNWRELDPDFYDRIMDVFPEMEVQERYYREYDQEGLADEYGESFLTVRRYIDKYIDDPIQNRLAHSKLELVMTSSKDPRKKDAYPPRYVIKQFITGGYKRGILPLGEAEKKAYREKAKK